MTALVVLERVSLDTWFVAPGYQPSSPAETRLGLVAGERMRVRDLLGALLLGSANDAAEALAVGTAGSDRGVRGADEPPRPAPGPAPTPASPTRSGSTIPATTRRLPTSRA